MSKRTPTIAITGAQGFIGGRIVEHFANKGWRVRALVRHIPEVRQPHVTYMQFDLARPIEPEMLNGVDYLVHAAYIKHSRHHPDALKLNLDGTKTLLKSCKDHKLKRIVFLSSLSAHSKALSSYGQQKFAIERLFGEPTDTVIRPGLVVGNGGLVREMADFMRTKHVVPLIGGGNQPVQIIGIDELVVAVDSIFTQDKSGTFTLASEQTYPYRDFYRLIAERINTKVMFVPLPFPAAKAIIKVGDLLHIPLAITEDNLLGLKQMKRLNTNASVKALHLRIRPLADTLKQTDFSA